MLKTRLENWRGGAASLDIYDQLVHFRFNEQSRTALLLRTAENINRAGMKSYGFRSLHRYG